jgi:hypothetical protein
MKTNFSGRETDKSNTLRLLNVPGRSLLNSVCADLCEFNVNILFIWDSLFTNVHCIFLHI